MAISLQKGGNVNLSKEAPGLTNLKVGLGWDTRATDGAAFDLDGAVFLLNASGTLTDQSVYRPIWDAFIDVLATYPSGPTPADLGPR